MNAFIRKEIRSLLPVFMLAITANVFTWLFSDDNQRYSNISGFIANVAGILCPVLLIMLALASFGSELSAGTFSNLLTQPVSRQRIWRTKISVLAAAFLIILATNFIGLVIFKPLYWYGEHLQNGFKYSGLLVSSIITSATLISGSLWTVLLLRQVAAAFWFSLLIPLAIFVLTIGFTGKDSNEISGLLFAIFTLYSIAGFLFARRMFLRAQDTQWTGGVITIPALRRFAPAGFASRTRRDWHPCLALLGKEFQLHQSQLVIAGMLAVLHLGVIFYRSLKTGLPGHPDLDFILHAFWLLWFVMPLLIGSAAVSEERKLGTLAGQFCLPVGRRFQWIAKLLITLIFAVVLGACMPLLFEGVRILPPQNLPLRFLNGDLPGFAMLCVLSASIAAISLYASTLARNTLQAVGPAIVMVILTWMLAALAPQPLRVFGDFPWRGILIYIIGLPVFTVVICGLSFWNFQWLVPAGKMFRWNILFILASFVFVILTTAAVYHRAWEQFTPYEPSHGPARFSMDDVTSLAHDFDTVTVRLADGRVWITCLNEYSEGINTRVLDHPSSFSPPWFADGSNWLTLRLDWISRQMVGLKTDGTLWVSEHVMSLVGFTNNAAIVPVKMVQFGTDTDWKANLKFGRLQILLKNDGTLWQWGVTNGFLYTNGWPGLQAYTPVRLNAGSDWADISTAGSVCLFRKTDGSVWTLDRYSPATNALPGIELLPGLALQRRPGLENNKVISTALASLWDGMSYQLGVFEDGSFRIWADRRDIGEKYFQWASTDLQLGTGTNWVAVAGWGDQLVTLKRDGSLWLWTFRYRNSRGLDGDRDKQEMTKSVPVRLGAHSDWVAIAYKPGGLLSLAADGSLVFWPIASVDFFYNPEKTDFPTLLEISHKPQKLASIFDTK